MQQPPPPQPPYPQQQYTPPSSNYWNCPTPVQIHQTNPNQPQQQHPPQPAPQAPNQLQQQPPPQTGYGPTHPAANQASIQSIPTPPSSIPPQDSMPNYHIVGGQPPHLQPTVTPQQPPRPNSMPYESRADLNMTNGYSQHYHQQQTVQPPPHPPPQASMGYYNSHDAQPGTDPSMSPYDNTLASWPNSNYYQPNQSTYPPSVMNSYQPHYSAGPNQNPSMPPPPPNQLPPTQMSQPTNQHYPQQNAPPPRSPMQQHHIPQQNQNALVQQPPPLNQQQQHQQWQAQNHVMPPKPNGIDKAHIPHHPVSGGAPNFGHPGSIAPSSIQAIPTPPSNMSDSMSPYPTNGTLGGQPPPMTQPQMPHQPQQQPNSLLYDNQVQNSYPGAYSNHQPVNTSYYGSHEVQQITNEHPSTYDMQQQQQQQLSMSPQNSWPNGGYYQPSQSPYSGAMSSQGYPQIPYNGSANLHNQPSPLPGPNHGIAPPPHMAAPNQYIHPHAPSQPNQMHNPHLNQHGPPPPQWQAHNQLPIIERNKTTGQEKKPVKPRAPKKQTDPNAPTGRRKRPYMTEEHKQSGYAKFYQIKRKELAKQTEFGEASSMIANLWNRLSEEERSIYAKDVSNKRKELLKKKASQQADLLVQGIKQEQDMPSL